MSRRLFVGEKEVKFFKSLNKELIQEIIGQKIIYYAVSEEHTNAHWLYEEAQKKSVYNPVEVNALILYKEPEQSVGQFSIDTIYYIDVYFYIPELKERLLDPKPGDFCKHGDILYEIEKITREQITFGQIDNEVMVHATCRVARKSQLEVFDGIPGV
jgi:hypothetical protein